MQSQTDYLSSPQIQEQCKNCVLRHFDDLIQCAGHFQNQYGRVDPFLEMQSHLPNYSSTDELFVHFHLKDDFLYFKVLPLDCTTDNCYYLRNPQCFDGFFCTKEQTQRIFDQPYVPYDVQYGQALLHPPHATYTLDFWF